MAVAVRPIAIELDALPLILAPDPIAIDSLALAPTIEDALPITIALPADALLLSPIAICSDEPEMVTLFPIPIANGVLMRFAVIVNS
ncbi:MAG: hypothetical protein HC877_23420 [Thioploca sp.]|nr:hypothetical protein [Thioploca sp.]